MTLAEFLVKRQMNPETFAAQVGVHATTIYRLLAYRTFPKKQNLKRILAATDGEVTVTELIRL
jgi:predicted DNA-binding transcriptional regulator AlpA